LAAAPRPCAGGCAPRALREIKEAVYDELAKAWLGDAKVPIETIAERLGFSDVFSFRRSFRRKNGFSPLAFRRQIAAGGETGPA
jgi:AraC-like DNA-binding protein